MTAVDWIGLVFHTAVGCAAGYFAVMTYRWRGAARMFEAQRNEMAVIASAAMLGDMDAVRNILRNSIYARFPFKTSSRGDA